MDRLCVMSLKFRAYANMHLVKTLMRSSGDEESPPLDGDDVRMSIAPDTERMSCGGNATQGDDVVISFAGTTILPQCFVNGRMPVSNRVVEYMDEVVLMREIRGWDLSNALWMATNEEEAGDVAEGGGI